MNNSENITSEHLNGTSELLIVRADYSSSSAISIERKVFITNININFTLLVSVLYSIDICNTPIAFTGHHVLQEAPL